MRLIKLGWKSLARKSSRSFPPIKGSIARSLSLSYCSFALSLSLSLSLSLISTQSQLRYWYSGTHMFQRKTIQILIADLFARMHRYGRSNTPACLSVRFGWTGFNVVFGQMLVEWNSILWRNVWLRCGRVLSFLIT